MLLRPTDRVQLGWKGSGRSGLSRCGGGVLPQEPPCWRGRLSLASRPGSAAWLAASTLRGTEVHAAHAPHHTISTPLPTPLDNLPHHSISTPGEPLPTPSPQPPNFHPTPPLPAPTDWAEAQGGDGEARPHGARGADGHPLQVRSGPGPAACCARCGHCSRRCPAQPSAAFACAAAAARPCPPPAASLACRLFEKQPRWNFAQLQKDTHQPTQHLKEASSEHRQARAQRHGCKQGCVPCFDDSAAATRLPWRWLCTLAKCRQQQMLAERLLHGVPTKAGCACAAAASVVRPQGMHNSQFQALLYVVYCCARANIPSAASLPRRCWARLL